MFDIYELIEEIERRIKETNEWLEDDFEKALSGELDPMSASGGNFHGAYDMGVSFGEALGELTAYQDMYKYLKSLETSFNEKQIRRSR